MIDKRNDSAHFIGTSEPRLSSPRFDENANANAQPVEPIPGRRIAAWRQHVGSIWSAIEKRSWSLALVVIAGLATGTLSGTAWVKHSQETSESPAVNETVSELPRAGTEDDEQGAVTAGSDLHSNDQGNTGATRIRKSRSRVRSSRAPRAYRVAVIR